MDTKNDIKLNKGASFDNAIVVETNNSQIGVAYEYKELKKIYPVHLVTLQYVTENNNKFYDVFEISLPNEEKTEVYFDITNFYGK